MIQVRHAKIGQILGLLAIAVILPLLTINLVSAQSGPTAITQGSTTVANGSTFTVDIVVSSDASSPIGAAQVYLEFDESYLQVVSGSHLTGPLIPGSVFDSTWEDVILNTANNNDGEVSFAGGKGRAGSDAQGDFVLARVQFQATSETPPGSGTDLIFNIAVPQRTRVVSGITDVTSTVFGTTIHVVNNAAPVADNDAYNVVQGATLNADANSGVLANDTDPDGGVLNAVLVNGVSNGSLALNSDGSFTYTHHPGFAGDDTFTYRANDGISSSDVTTVTISVLANLDVSFTASLQGRPPPPDSSWVLGFTVDFYSFDADPMSEGPLESYSVTTNENGLLQVSVAPGIYDIRIKGANTLRDMLPDVDLMTPPTAAIDIGVQIAGDSNGDNVVEGQDYSDVQNAFGSTVSNLPPNLQRTDHNGDDIVDISDYSIVVDNFGASGALP